MSRSNATLLGFGAILSWTLLAYFTIGAKGIPPLQLNAMCFLIGGTVGLIWSLVRSGRHVFKAIPLPAWALGVGGLFGFHFCFFTALTLAPAAPASLICYLWPLLIVLFSGLLPGEHIRWQHVVGALVAFGGAGLLILPDDAGFEMRYLAGYGVALIGAFIWSGYSVLSRLFSTVPTSAVALFCLASSLLSAVAHLALEQTVWPQNATAWGAVLALGLGPVGLAFFLWDIGVKVGNIQLLGILSYCAPLFSTLILVLSGHAAPNPQLAIAALMITGGAALAGLVGRSRKLG